MAITLLDEAGHDALDHTGLTGVGGAGLGAWTSYSPAWTGSVSDPSLGNGTLTGRYKALDSKTYAIQIHLTAGSTTTFGSGNFEFSLPPGVTSGALRQMLAGSALNLGVRWFVVNGMIDASATKVSIVVHSESFSAGQVQAAAPFAWANGAQLILSGIIEVV